MKYDYEFKRKCIEKYRRGEWEETPEGMKKRYFHYMIRTWARMEKSCGLEALKNRNGKKEWAADEKYELVAKVIGGNTCRSVAITAGIDPSLLRRWVKRYIMEGYQGLAVQRKGRPPKEASMKKKTETGALTEQEREEMSRLKRENERLRAENEIIKKEIALREERQAAQLKARKQCLSKNSMKKDTQ